MIGYGGDITAGQGRYRQLCGCGAGAQGVTKFGVYFMLPRVDKMVDKYYNQAVNNPLFADMFDENGNVDIDAVYDAAKTAMDRMGQIEMYGFRFGRNDIDMLYDYIRSTM